MKKQIILMAAVLIVGGLVVLLPYFRSSNNTAKQVQIQEVKKKALMQQISSNENTIKDPDIPNDKRELETYDKNQMFFDNVENLYKYFQFAQVEDIKQRLQTYIHQNIDKNILDGTIITKSIQETDGKVSFELTVNDNKTIDVEVTKDKDNKISDCTITYSIPK